MADARDQSHELTGGEVISLEVCPERKDDVNLICTVGDCLFCLVDRIFGRCRTHRKVDNRGDRDAV